MCLICTVLAILCATLSTRNKNWPVCMHVYVPSDNKASAVNRLKTLPPLCMHVYMYVCNLLQITEHLLCSLQAGHLAASSLYACTHVCMRTRMNVCYFK